MEAVAQTPAVVGDDNGVETGCRWTHNNPPMPRRRPCPDRLRWRDQQRRSDSAGLCNSHDDEEAPVDLRTRRLLLVVGVAERYAVSVGAAPIDRCVCAREG